MSEKVGKLQEKVGKLQEKVGKPSENLPIFGIADEYFRLGCQKCLPSRGYFGLAAPILGVGKPPQLL
jgi:hypothetical protein